MESETERGKHKRRQTEIEKMATYLRRLYHDFSAACEERAVEETVAKELREIKSLLRSFKMQDRLQNLAFSVTVMAYAMK